MINLLARDHPVTITCDILGMARSSYYYQAAEALEEIKLKEAIKETAAKMANLRLSAHCRATETQRLDGEPQACAASDALDGHSEQEQAQEEAHNRQPALVSSLSESGLGYGDRATRPGVGV
jgi:hypothetical protein